MVRLGVRQVASLVGAAIRLSWTGGTWRPLAAMCGMAVLLGTAPVAAAWAMKEVFDGIARGAGLAELTGFVLQVAGLGAVVMILPQVQAFAEAEFGRSLAVTSREALHRAVNGIVGIGRLEDSRFQDRLRMAAQAGQSGPADVVACVISAGQAGLALAGFVGSLLVLSPWMLVIVMVASLPTIWAELVLNRRRAEVTLALGHASRREIFYSQLLTGVAAAKEVRLFGLGDFLCLRMLKEIRHINRQSRALDRRDAVTHSVLAGLGAVVTGAGLIWAIGAAAARVLSVGDVAVFVAAAAGAQSGLGMMLNSLGRVYHSVLLFSEYRAVVAGEPDLSGAADRVPPNGLNASIEFKDVWFRYDESHPWILRGLDLSIRAGASTALVGVNGAGKTTLVKLLCRFYDPVKGAILWDGVDIQRFPPDLLRERIGAVFQDFVSYELSARENVGLGDVSYVDDDGRVRQAVERAGCAATVAGLPEGLDTMLTRTFFDSEDRDDPRTGVVLSGGQWQRLALARALMRADRDLLILDEPSSGLDADAEHDIHERLRELRAGRTSLLISHRLSTLRDAETIAVLDDGCIAELGVHNELMARGGIYARLFSRQANGYRTAKAAT